jgi:hypothetical protein
VPETRIGHMRIKHGKYLSIQRGLGMVNLYFQYILERYLVDMTFPYCKDCSKISIDIFLIDVKISHR